MSSGLPRGANRVARYRLGSLRRSSSLFQSRMWLGLEVALLCLLLLPRDSAPAKQTGKNPVVQVGSLGTLKGVELSLSRSQRANAFYGIPYATAPVGQYRFKEPTRPWPRWEGTRDATEMRPSCMQPRDLASKADLLGLAEKLKKRIVYNEDCLYLNVFAPEGKAPSPWPVIIWFHPGDFNVGSPAVWDGSILAIKQKVIIVTASYRLNIFGFMATKDNKIPGNLGLLDQVAVMDWVQDNIRFFNGSKDDVTLWGHSSGAVSVSLHLLTPLSSAKFHRAIIMSGNFFSPNVVKGSLYSDQIADEIGCDKDNLVKCMEKASAETLLAIAEDYEWGPTVSKERNEYAFITSEPEKLPEDGEVVVNSVPLMTGYTDMEDIAETGITSEAEFRSHVKEVVMGMDEDNETCAQGELLSESVLFYYSPEGGVEGKGYAQKYIEMITERKYGSSAVKLAGLNKRSENFLYRFDYRLKTPGFGEAGDSGVPSQFELPFFWGMPYWASLSPPLTWNTQDKRTTDIVMGLFGNFTKNSKPAENRRGIQWDPLDSAQPQIFIIDKNPHMSNGEFNSKSMMFWNDYYPKLKSHIKYCCSLHSSGYRKAPIHPFLLGLTLLLWYLLILLR